MKANNIFGFAKLVRGTFIMSITIYSAPGCLRCKIVKQYLTDSRRTFQDFDALGDAKEGFKSFYRENREKIYRGPEGVEFPIFCEEEIIRQGLPPVVAYLMAGSALNGFFKPGLLHGQWIDGIHVSGGDPARSQAFLEVLIFLKKQYLKLELETNGVNAALLEQALDQGLVDRVVMDVIGPAKLYESIVPGVDPDDIGKSIALTSKCEDYYFYSTVAPIIRTEGDLEQYGYITPEEIGAAAQLIKNAAGDSKQPYRLKAFDPQAAQDPRLKEFEALPKNELFKYRTMARRFQFKTEIA
jgi:pyruvate formate lyase activating enzyme